ncbi:MAG: ABC transporter permease [Notoacmeibacter sp.]|nr:ABC transporter permease [Notoacmeibacter sp.]
MSAVLAIAGVELRIALRNLWVALAVGLMAVFAAVLTFAGSGPTGTLGVDLLAVAVASLTTLTVYLAPLIALLLAFDAIAGEAERGTLALLLTYPVSRLSLVAGKFVAHLGVLAFALAIGFGLAGVMAWAIGGAAGGISPASLLALVKLWWTSVLLGAAFLGFGYALSARARQPGVAAGLAIGLWLVLVVLYDLAMLGALIADNGGVFTRTVFPWMLVSNPADAFRIVNMPAGEAQALASGISGAAKAVSSSFALSALAAWSLGALALGWVAFRKVEP